MFRLLVGLLVLAQLSVPAAQASDEPIVHKPIRSFLGSQGTEQLDYVTGLLDAWSMMQHNGEPKPWFFKCVDWGEDSVKLQVRLHVWARSAAEDAEDGFLPEEIMRYIADLCFLPDDPKKPKFD